MKYDFSYSLNGLNQRRGQDLFKTNTGLIRVRWIFLLCAASRMNILPHLFLSIVSP